jgi:hypothetical protein
VGKSDAWRAFSAATWMMEIAVMEGRKKTVVVAVAGTVNSGRLRELDLPFLEVPKSAFPRIRVETAW